jgi:hypothetical protein
VVRRISDESVRVRWAGAAAVFSEPVSAGQVITSTSRQFCNDVNCLVTKRPVSSIRTHHFLATGGIMSVNILANESIERTASDERDRLPTLTAGVVIFGLSLLCWAALLLPVYTFVHH